MISIGLIFKQIASNRSLLFLDSTQILLIYTVLGRNSGLFSRVIPPVDTEQEIRLKLRPIIYRLLISLSVTVKYKYQFRFSVID